MSNKNGILLGDKRDVDFLLPKTRVQSRLERFNHFSLIAEMHPFLLEVAMRGNYVRTQEIRDKISKGLKGHIPWNKGKKCPYFCGKNNPRWNNGVYNRPDGYVMILCPNHPKAKGRYVMEHILVMEKHLGRYLSSNEIVHHLGKRNDNRIEKLKLMKSDKHKSYHSRLYWTPENKKKMSDKLKLEYKMGLRKSYGLLGKHHTEEAKKKMSLASKGISKTLEHRKAMVEGWKRRKLLLSLLTQENSKN